MDTPICSQQRGIVTVLALLFGPVFMAGPVAGGIWILVATGPSLQSLLLLPVFVGGSGFIAYHMLQNFHWVEFDGIRIRGRRFWTRRMVEGTVEEVAEIRPLAAVVSNHVTTAVDALLAPVRGYEIRFRNGTTVGLIRHDMTNADELARAIERAVKRHRIQSTSTTDSTFTLPR